MALLEKSLQNTTLFKFFSSLGEITLAKEYFSKRSSKSEKGRMERLKEGLEEKDMTKIIFAMEQANKEEAESKEQSKGESKRESGDEDEDEARKEEEKVRKEEEEVKKEAVQTIKKLHQIKYYSDEAMKTKDLKLIDLALKAADDFKLENDEIRKLKFLRKKVKEVLQHGNFIFLFFCLVSVFLN
jgi:hypothetical protein